jgi:hypothetical protein
MAKNHARVTIPILCAIDAGKVTFEDIIVDGNRAAKRKSNDGSDKGSPLRGIS